MPAAGDPGASPASVDPGASPAHVRRLRDRVQRLAARLERRYGPARKPELDPLDELVLTILSQNTTDLNRDRAWESLQRSFDDWDEVRRAPRERLEEAIREAGLAGQKAAAIQEALERLRGEMGAESLDHLREMADAEAMAYLSSFRGVGVKTAACVLCFALGRPVIPVDTHVHRVSRRLGLVDEDATRNQAHHALNDLVPPELRFPLHIQLIRLGRDVCRARRPRCGVCPLEELCPKVGAEGVA